MKIERLLLLFILGIFLGGVNPQRLEVRSGACPVLFGALLSGEIGPSQPLQARVAHAEDDEECSSVDECRQLREEREQELMETTVEKEETELEQTGVGEQLVVVGNQLSATQTELEALGDQKLTKEEERQQKIELRNQLIRLFYKYQHISPLELFLSSGSFSDLAQNSATYKAVVLAGLSQIEELSGDIAGLTQDIETETGVKLVLEGEEANLSARHQDLGTEIEGLGEQISGLEASIEEINQLIAKKLSATSRFMSVGEYETAWEDLPEPPFANAFAVFSYGYPHRVGMSQYGAYGRSKDGQDYKEILEAYYDDIEITEHDCPDEIEVQGVGKIDFEDNYLRGIAEMPSSWGDKGGMEALKAQAIAARTYALAYTNNGEGSICNSESCQVYLASKVDNDAAAKWHEAVEETKGEVMLHGGSPIKAWYSSTAGGYTRLPTDFDVKWSSTPGYIKRIHDADDDGNAYDGPEYGNSPWFYKAWFSASNDDHPWLHEEEIRDLLNAALLYVRDSDKYGGHLVQEDPISGPEGWSKEEVREALEDEGIDPLDEVLGVVSVSANEGYTDHLQVETSSGSRTVDGRAFYSIFVRRSPGYLALWSSLYDIARR